MPFYKNHHPADLSLMLALYWDNGKENGNYYSILGLYWGYIGVILKVVVCLGTSVEPVTPSRAVSFGRGLLACTSLPPSVRLSTCGPVMKAATCKLRHGALVCFMGHPTQDNDPPLYIMRRGFFDKVLGKQRLLQNLAHLQLPSTRIRRPVEDYGHDFALTLVMPSGISPQNILRLARDAHATVDDHDRGGYGRAC